MWWRTHIHLYISFRGKMSRLIFSPCRSCVSFSSNGRLPALRPTSALPRTMDLFDKPMLCSWRNRWDSNSTKRSTLSVPERMFIFFKFFLTKIVHLDCSKVYLIKAISNTKKELHWERHEANQMFTFLVPMHLHLLRIWKSNKHHGLQSQVL